MAEPTREEKRQALAQLIEGKPDAEILDAVEAGGIERLLGQLFEAIAEAFLPERAAGKEAVIQYDVKAGDSVHSYQMKVAGGVCTMAQGAPDRPRVTLALAVPDLLRLVANKVSGQQLFMSGNLKIQGDTTIAMVIQQWFQT
jgi:putative sterol carrier protein